MYWIITIGYLLMAVVINLLYGLDCDDHKRKIVWIVTGTVYAYVAGVALGRIIWR